MREARHVVDAGVIGRGSKDSWLGNDEVTARMEIESRGGVRAGSNTERSSLDGTRAARCQVHASMSW